MSNRAKVYVTQKPPTDGKGHPKLDLTPAKMYGELIFLSHRGEIEAGTEQELLWKFRERLKDYDPRCDYILPIGHTIVMVVGAMAALESGDGQIRILQWHRQLRTYEVYTLDLHAQPQNGRKEA